MVVVARMVIRLLLRVVSIFGPCFDHGSHMAEISVLVGCGRLPLRWLVVLGASTSAHYEL